MESQKMRVSEKVAMITGGGSGIGKGIAEKFVAEGAKVMIADVNRESLDKRKSELENACETITVNATVEKDIEKAVLKTVERFGKLDIGVNNIGGGGALAMIKDLAEEHWNNTMDTTLKSVFLSMKHEARQMIS